MSSCKDDTPEISIPEEEDTISESTLNVNHFIYDNMKENYFWNNNMPDIDSKKEQDSEEYFYKLLKTPEDKWSYITDNLNELLEFYDRIYKTNGISFQLFYLDSSEKQIIGIVEFVYKDSPADSLGLKRGDTFCRINGQIMTNLNYQELLSLEQIKLTLCQIYTSGLIEEKGEVEIVSTIMKLNPITTTSIINSNSIKIGYIAYNSFSGDEDNEDLINTFLNFKTEGIDELVLDLRYNGGGFATTAFLMANLIAPESAVGEVFIREIWNENNKNENKTIKLEANEANLNLQRIFILTSAGTASASEMIIYGLSPHMDVIHIGETTTGKYYGSVLFYDENYKNPRGHNWAIMPIVMRAENKTKSINYYEGLIPRYLIPDNNYNADLGDPEEYYLAQVISLITNGSLNNKNLKSSTGFGYKKVKDSGKNKNLLIINNRIDLTK